MWNNWNAARPPELNSPLAATARRRSGQIFAKWRQAESFFRRFLSGRFRNRDEDLTAGFQRAAEIYQSRASYRTELLLYSALPCSVLALGMVIMSQIQPVLAVFSH